MLTPIKNNVKISYFFLPAYLRNYQVDLIKCKYRKHVPNILVSEKRILVPIGSGVQKLFHFKVGYITLKHPVGYAHDKNTLNTLAANLR